ncbi:MAG: hypothetical protein SF051_07490 [Elusimicrobiota bacterium]|nr:hypothetical protein [Elusimicrobiota bacterium]
MSAVPDPARVHDAMVLAFAERETRADAEVRALLAKKGYGQDEIDAAMLALPPLGPGRRPQSAARKPAYGPWAFSAAAGLVMLAAIVAFSCGRTPP